MYNSRSRHNSFQCRSVSTRSSSSSISIQRNMLESRQLVNVQMNLDRNVSTACRQKKLLGCHNVFVKRTCACWAGGSYACCAAERSKALLCILCIPSCTYHKCWQLLNGTANGAHVLFDCVDRQHTSGSIAAKRFFLCRSATRLQFYQRYMGYICMMRGPTTYLPSKGRAWPPFQLLCTM